MSLIWLNIQKWLGALGPGPLCPPKSGAGYIEYDTSVDAATFSSEIEFEEPVLTPNDLNLVNSTGGIRDFNLSNKISETWHLVSMIKIVFGQFHCYCAKRKRRALPYFSEINIT